MLFSACRSNDMFQRTKNLTFWQCAWDKTQSFHCTQDPKRCYIFLVWSMFKGLCTYCCTPLVIMITAKSVHGSWGLQHTDHKLLADMFHQHEYLPNLFLVSFSPPARSILSWCDCYRDELGITTDPWHQYYLSLHSLSSTKLCLQWDCALYNFLHRGCV